jgi:hypothetical protein
LDALSVKGWGIPTRHVKSITFVLAPVLADDPATGMSWDFARNIIEVTRAFMDLALKGLPSTGVLMSKTY